MSSHIGRRVRHMNEKSQEEQKLKNHTMLHCKHDLHKKNVGVKKKRQFEKKFIQKISKLHMII